MDYHETFQTPLLPTKRNGPGKQRARVGVETYSVPSREGVAASHKVGRQESGAERTQKEHCPTLPMSLFLFGAPWRFTVHRACVQGFISLPAWRQEGRGVAWASVSHSTLSAWGAVSHVPVCKGLGEDGVLGRLTSRIGKLFALGGANA